MPYFIAWLYLLFGSYFAVIFVHLILGSIIPVLGVRLARYITDRRGIPIVVGVFLALEPTMALLSTELLSDTLFTFLFCLSLLCLFRFLKQRDTRILLLSALLLGVATLVRSSAGYFALLVGILLLWEGRKQISRTLLVRAGLYLFVFLLTLSPWLYRNYSTFGAIGLSSQQGAQLYGVVVPSVLSIKNGTNFAEEQPAGLDALGNTTFAESAEYTKRALPLLLDSPGATLLFSINMTFAFFTFDGTYDILRHLKVDADLYSMLTEAKRASGIPVGASTLLAFTSSPLSALQFLFTLSTTPLALLLLGRALWILITLALALGAWYFLHSSRRTTYTIVAIIAIGYFMLMTFAAGFNISARYRLPANPFIFTFAICGIVVALSWCRTKLNAYRTR